MSDENAVDQSSYIDDFFATASPESVEEPAPTEEPPQAEPPKEEPPQAEPSKEEPPQAEPPKEEKSIIEKTFASDDGSFDADSFLNFTLPDSFGADAETSDDPVLPEQPPEEPDTREEWQKDMEEERAYVKDMTEQGLGPLLEVGRLIDEGVDPKAALQQIFAQRNDLINSNIEEYKYKRNYERSQRTAEAEKENTRMAGITERAKTNALSIVESLPGKTHEEKAALYGHILFSPEIGAPIINREFKRAYPDYEKLPEAQQKELGDKFFREIQSDPKELRYFWDLAMAKAARVHQKQLLAHERARAVADENDKLETAQKGPSRYRQQKPAEKQSGPSWGGYFDSV